MMIKLDARTCRTTFASSAVFLALLTVSSAQASSAPLAHAKTPTLTFTYRGGNVNTMTIKGNNFDLFSLLNLSPVDSQGFSYSGNTQISVLTSNGNAPIFLLDTLLTSNGNYYYTVKVAKSGVAKAVCKAVQGELPTFAFTATNDNPPTRSTFTMTFVVQNVGSLPLTGTKNPRPTLQGLPNITLQIGSAFFTATKITKNKATYP